MVETILMSAVALLVVATLTEALTEILKSVIVADKFKDKVTFFVSIAIGITLAIVLKINLFGLEDTLGQYVGMVCAGILASRGANYISGILKKFELVKSPEGK